MAEEEEKLSLSSPTASNMGISTPLLKESIAETRTAYRIAK